QRPPVIWPETTTCSQLSEGATGTAACRSGPPQSLSPITASAAPPLVRAQARSVYQPSARPVRVCAVCAWKAPALRWVSCCLPACPPASTVTASVAPLDTQPAGAPASSKPGLISTDDVCTVGLTCTLRHPISPIASSTVPTIRVTPALAAGA